MMGSVSAKLSRAYAFACEQLELAINTAFFEVDCAGRFLTNGLIGDIWNFFEELYMKAFYLASNDPEESDVEKICIDREGVHFVGESWRSRDQCNLRKCIALDVIKEFKCPAIERKDGCRLKKGDPDGAFPDCCDRQICPFHIQPINVAPLQETWIRNESADWAFETSSGEEVDDNFREYKITEKGLVPNELDF